MTYEYLNNIDKMQVTDKNNLYIGGKDKDGKDIAIIFDCSDFLKWFDKDGIDYIKRWSI